jgi:hypothetical protein
MIVRIPTLSQQAFKGELDLSHVPLPLDNDKLRQ